MTDEEIRIDERKKISARIRQMQILRMGGKFQGSVLEQANNIIQNIADDIENNFTDYQDDKDR